MTTWRILEGDCRDRFAVLEAGSVHTCVTSPPYFGLRDYGHDGQIGLEPTPDEFVAALVGVFREVRRVLRDDGTVWLNLGDSYASSPPGIKTAERYATSTLTKGGKAPGIRAGNDGIAPETAGKLDTSRLPGCKPKDLLGIPWLVAFALRADGWYLRSDIIEEVELYCPCGCGYVMEERIWRYEQDREIIWKKPNPMPESVRDRPTKAHEYLFLLSKSPRYYYDADAIREEPVGQSDHDLTGNGYAPPGQRPSAGNRQAFRGGNSFNNSAQKPNEVPGNDGIPRARNKRSVWTVATVPYPGAHFATFPPKLIEPCILAGCPEGGTVLDPFAGAGTTGMVALRHGRS